MNSTEYEQENYLSAQINKAKKYEILADYSKFLESELQRRDAEINHIKNTKGQKILQKLYGVKSIPRRTRNYVKRVTKSAPKPVAIDYTKIRLKKKLIYKPKISIIMPVYNVRREYLIYAIESVIHQTYENWELCIVDDCSTQRHVKKVLKKYEHADERIKIEYSDKNLHIAGASNKAIRNSTGDYIGFLDNDDVLRSNALEEVAYFFNSNPDCRALYSDNYIIDEYNHVINHMIKPDFSPELFLTTSYMVHFCVFDAKLLRNGVGLNESPRYKGTQDIEIKVRLISQGVKFSHIPEALYYWRASNTSTARTFKNKSGMKDNSIHAFEDMLKTYYKCDTLSIEMPEDAKEQGLGYYALNLKKLTAKILLIIHVESKTELNNNLERRVRNLLKECQIDTVYLCEYGCFSESEKGFNLRNDNILDLKKYCGYDYCLLLDGNTKDINKNSLYGILSYLLLSEDIAAVGGKVSSLDDRIQAGAYLFMNNIQIMHGGIHKNGTLSERYAQNVLAVSWGLMAIRGCDFVTDYVDCLIQYKCFSDIVFCLKKIREGKRIVYNPRAESRLKDLYHNSTIWNFRKPEYKEVKNANRDYFCNDPYYSKVYSNKYQYTIVEKEDISPQ